MPAHRPRLNLVCLRGQGTDHRRLTSSWLTGKARQARHAFGCDADLHGDRPRAIWSKLNAHAARLALILHLLPPGGEDSEVQPATVEAAWTLVDYFKGHLRRAHSVTETEAGCQDAAAVMD